MDSGDEIALDLAARLLAGERGKVQSHLTMLLEKSSSLRDSDDFYASMLPPEIAGITVTEATRDRIIAQFCNEIAREPDEALISAVSFTGADLVTRTIAMLVAEPPRPLTLNESTYAWSLLNKFLWPCLKEDRTFLPDPVLARIVELAKEYMEAVPGDGEMQKPLRIELKQHAEGLLRGLGYAGMT